jgi:hypothetical protein
VQAPLPGKRTKEKGRPAGRPSRVEETRFSSLLLNSTQRFSVFA